MMVKISEETYWVFTGRGQAALRVVVVVHSRFKY